MSSEQEEIMALNAKIAHLDKQLGVEQANKNKTKTKEENKKKNNDKDSKWMKEKPNLEESKRTSDPN